MKFIPFSKPSIGHDEIKEVVKTLKSGWLTTGEKTEQFESNLKTYIGCKEIIAVNSCTSALHLALKAFGVGSGDEVITTPFTFASTANSIIHTGAKPVFCDIEENTFNIDYLQIEKKITSRTRAVIPVHFAGHPANLDEIQNVAKKHNLIVIEDAAHALGSEYKGKKIGNNSDAACFSFYVTKNITTGEGGAVAVKSKKISRKIRQLALHGMSKDAFKRYRKRGNWYYEILDAGFKYNMNDIQASIGIHQLKKLDRFIRIKKQIASKYNKEFKNLKGVRIPYAYPNIRHAWHLYPVLVTKNRNKIIEKMKNKNIGLSVHFIPLHFMPFYKKSFSYSGNSFPFTEKVYNKIVSLPLYPSLKKIEIDYIVKSFRKIIYETD